LAFRIVDGLSGVASMSWAVTVRGDGRQGTGAVISPRLVLTCWHVVGDMPDAMVVVAGAESKRCDVIGRNPARDLALLSLTDGEAALADELVVVPRALWRGAPVIGDRALVQLAIDEQADLPSSVEVALRPAAASAGHVEFVVAAAREGVKHGFSGAPVVELQAGRERPRMLGIVRARDPLTVDVLDHAGTGWLVPVERIAECFDKVAALVETPFERDAAWPTHWEPRSRGVATRSDHGFFFSGRERAYARVREHLDRGSGLLIVTGPRGWGKSALLSRVVALSSRRYLTLLGAQRECVINGNGGQGGLDAAVFARDRAPGWVAAQLALQLGYRSGDIADLVARCADEPRPLSAVVDAVDESEDPAALIGDVVVELAAAGVRIAIAGLRQRIVRDVPQRATWVDLGDAQFGDDAIPEYATRRLSGAATYTSPEARIVAREIGAGAEKNFLVAELVCRTLARRDPIDTTAPGWQDEIPSDLTDAFNDYLGRFGEQREDVLALLHPLAHARGDGLTVDPPEIWLRTANALRPDTLDPFEHADLRKVSRRAADYLIASAGNGERRLYHQDLADVIARLSASEQLLATGQNLTSDAIGLQARSARRRFVETLIAQLPGDRGAAIDAYARLDPYLHAHLPAHLADIGQATELLERPGMLLTCDAASLRAALVRDALRIPSELEAVRVAVVHALAGPLLAPDERAAALCAALRRQGECTRADQLRDVFESALSYELVNGPPLVPVLVTIPDAHMSKIVALAVVEHDGQPLIISGDTCGALRSWRVDGSPGPLSRDDTWINALAVVEHDGLPLIVSAGGALHTVRPDGSVGPLTCDATDIQGISALAVAAHNGAPLIIAAGGDSSLYSWHLDGTPGPLTGLHAHERGISALVVVKHDGAPLIISAGHDGALCSWHLDGSPGPLTRPDAHYRAIFALTVVEHDGERLIISAGYDCTLYSWRLDGSPGPLIGRDAHDGWIRALAVVEDNGEPLIISAGEDRALYSWRPDGTQGPLTCARAHDGAILALAVVEHDDAPLIVSAGYDRALRIWHPDAPGGSLTHDDSYDRGISALATVEHNGAPVIISATNGGALRSWHLDGTDGPLTCDHTRSGGILALAVVEHDGPPLVITASTSGTLRSWHLDGSEGPLIRQSPTRFGIPALAVVEHEGAPLIISADARGALRSWHLDGSKGPLACDNPDSWFTALTVVEHDGQPLIISADTHGALHSWHLDGSGGPLTRHDAHECGISALAVVNQDGAPLMISADTDGALHSWHLDGSSGPLTVDDTLRGGIGPLVVIEHDGQPLIISAGFNGALRSWRLDGSERPLTHDEAHVGWIRALAVVEHNGAPLIISAGEDQTIVCRELHLDH
jgi:WD40 repeat protein